MTPEQAIIHTELMGRLLQEPAYGLVIPVADTPGQGDNLALSIATKSLTEKKDLDKSLMCVHCVISDETEPDRARETVELKSLNLDGWRRLPIGLFHHNRMMPVSYYQDPNTKAFTVTQTGKQLRGVEYFVQKGPMAAIANDVFELIDSGMLMGKSLGFVAAYSDYKRVPINQDDPYGKANVTVVNAKAFEASSVFIPENDRSLVTMVVRKGLSGGRQLHPALMPALAPYADPPAVYANGWTPPAAAGVITNPPTEEKGKEMAGTQTPPPEVRVETKEVRVEVIPDAVKAKADAADWYEKAIGKSLGFDLTGAGKPSQKCLKGMHDAAMFSAANALATAEQVDGPVEKALGEFVANQTQLAAQIAEYHKELYGTDPEWAAFGLDDFVGPNAKTGDREKELQQRSVQWAIQLKGWGRGATTRVKALGEAAAAALAAPADKPLPDELRARLKTLEAECKALVAENGTLVLVQDMEYEAQVKELAKNLDAAEARVKSLEATVRRARAGHPV